MKMQPPIPLIAAVFAVSVCLSSNSGGGIPETALEFSGASKQAATNEGIALSFDGTNSLEINTRKVWIASEIKEQAVELLRFKIPDYAKGAFHIGIMDASTERNERISMGLYGPERSWIVSGATIRSTSRQTYFINGSGVYLEGTLQPDSSLTNKFLGRVGDSPLRERTFGLWVGKTASHWVLSLKDDAGGTMGEELRVPFDLVSEGLSFQAIIRLPAVEGHMKDEPCTVVVTKAPEQ